MGHLSSIKYKTKTPRGEGKEDRTPNVYVGHGTQDGVKVRWASSLGWCHLQWDPDEKTLAKRRPE